MDGNARFQPALIAAVLALLLLGGGTAFAGNEPARISKEELKAMLKDPAVTVIDVRYKPNWAKSGQKIAGAVRENPNDVSSWADKYRKDQVLVFYCD